MSAAAGVLTEFPIPTANSFPFCITTGPDGNLWFTESEPPQIGTRRADHAADLDQLIARAKREVYTSGHGETITPSPTGKE